MDIGNEIRVIEVTEFDPVVPVEPLEVVWDDGEIARPAQQAETD